MKVKSKSAVSIIKSTDGPTSVFLAGGAEKIPLNIKIQNQINKYRGRLAKKKIVAGTHTLEELVQYAMNNYSLIEIYSNERTYIEQRDCLKQHLLLKYKPELLDEMNGEMSDSVISMNFHLYEIRIDDNFLKMDIDYIWDIFSISYSGDKKVMKQFRKISRDLHLYYGVSEDDIKNKTERYLSLLAILSL